MNIDRILAKITTATRDERHRMRQNALEKLEAGEAAWTAAAQQLLDAIEAQERQEHTELVAEVAGLEPAARVLKAFRAEPMTETEEKLIRVLLDNPGSTSGELTEKLGWKAHSWHLHFGTMCANRGVYLGPPPHASLPSGKFYSGILADFDDNGNRFTMKADVAAAFEQLGLRRHS